MRIRHLVIVVAFLCVACEQVAPPAKVAVRVPQVRATVITIRTVVQPESRVWMQTIMIGGGVARASYEQDVWRLFDTNDGAVTVVDAIDRTARRESFESIVTRRRAATATRPAPFIPRVTFTRTGEQTTVLGTIAEGSRIEAGGYRRDLWTARHPAIPPALFSMMHLSEEPTSPLASMMRPVDDAIAEVRGFPMIDRTEVPLGATTMTVTRTVVSITERPVPAALLKVPVGYKQLP